MSDPTTTVPSEPTGPIGAYVPPRMAQIDVAPPDPGLVASLRAVSGLSSAVADELDRLGVRTTVPAGQLSPLRPADVAIGRAVTLRYLPTRRPGTGVGRLAHLTLFGSASAGDVAVIACPAGSTGSALGGRAAAAAVAAGLAGCIVDGAIRDLDEIDASGLPTWARLRTPLTGRGRIEAVEINGPVEIGGVQVLPGDVVVADASGLAAIPADLFAAVAGRILDG